MKILVLGAAGTIGNALFALLEKSRHNFLGTVRSKHQQQLLGKKHTVLLEVLSGTDTNLEVLFGAWKPDVVVNCIGIIRPTSDMEKRYIELVNTRFPFRVKRLCNRYAARLIHLSTDCVFSGVRGGYGVGDIPDNLTLYGRTKAAGEITELPHVTIRTSIIGRELETNRNLLDWFLKSEESVVPGYTHAMWNGVSTITLGKIILRIIEKNIEIQTPIVHIASQKIDKYAILSIVKKVYNVQKTIVKDNSLYVDRTIIPWEKQSDYFGDLILNADKQIQELKRYYPTV